MKGLLSYTKKGIYCEKADVFIDPWRPVDKAIITHAHADHSRWGMKKYIAHHHSIPVMKHRLGNDIDVTGKNYGEDFNINGVKFSLHPAGHIIGSAQVRVEYKGEVWVVSGDYKTEPDSTCTPFEAVQCHTFITESTFGLPVYDWIPSKAIYSSINQWWETNQAQGKVSILLGYSLGKAQRIIEHLNQDIGKVYTHGAIENTNEVLRSAGISVPTTTRITKETDKKELIGNMIIAPPSAHNTPWMRKFKPYSVGITSGWMALRGARRRRNADRGFVMSDHADWNGLNAAVEATGAENIYVTHGYSATFAQWLNEKGKNAHVLETEYEGELSEIGESKLKEKEEEQA